MAFEKELSEMGCVMEKDDISTPEVIDLLVGADVLYTLDETDPVTPVFFFLSPGANPYGLIEAEGKLVRLGAEGPTPRPGGPGTSAVSVGANVPTRRGEGSF